MENLNNLFAEYCSLTALGKVQFWVSLCGFTFAGLLSSLLSWSKLGRTKAIIKGMDAQIGELQSRNSKQSKEMYDLRVQKRALEPEGKLEAVDNALRDGNLKSYAILMENLHRLVKPDAHILTRLARYHSSLIFSMNPMQLEKATNYAYAAHHLNKGIVEAQALASELQRLSTVIEKVVDVTISDKWPAQDSEPEFLVAGICHLAPRLYGMSFNWIAFSLVERGYRVVKTAKNLPEVFRGLIALEMCKTLEAIGDAEELEKCSRFELSRMESLESEHFDQKVWLVVKRHLATAIIFSGKFREGLQILDELIPKMSAEFGDENVSTLVARQMRTNALGGLGTPDIEECRRIARIFEKTHGPTASHTVISQMRVVMSLREAGRISLAAKLLRRIDGKHRRRLGNDHFLIRQFDQIQDEISKGSRPIDT